MSATIRAVARMRREGRSDGSATMIAAKKAAAIAVRVSLGIGLAVAGGLASGWSSGRVERAPVKQLPPGLVILAQPQTPQGIIKIGLHRIRFLGKVRLCINEADQPGSPRGGLQACANYPLGPSSGHAVGHAHLFLAPIYGGHCRHKSFVLVAGVVLSPGLSAQACRAQQTCRVVRMSPPCPFPAHSTWAGLWCTQWSVDGYSTLRGRALRDAPRQDRLTRCRSPTQSEAAPHRRPARPDRLPAQCRLAR